MKREVVVNNVKLEQNAYVGNASRHQDMVVVYTMVDHEGDSVVVQKRTARRYNGR